MNLGEILENNIKKELKKVETGTIKLDKYEFTAKNTVTVHYIDYSIEEIPENDYLFSFYRKYDALAYMRGNHCYISIKVDISKFKGDRLFKYVYTIVDSLSYKIKELLRVSTRRVN